MTQDRQNVVSFIARGHDREVDDLLDAVDALLRAVGRLTVRDKSTRLDEARSVLLRAKMINALIDTLRIYQQSLSGRQATSAPINRLSAAIWRLKSL